jgi:hypothetical protein
LDGERYVPCNAIAWDACAPMVSQARMLTIFLPSQQCRSTPALAFKQRSRYDKERCL